MQPPDEPQNCCFDEWASANAKRARSRETVAGVSRALLSSLEETGLEGRTVLDVGCGAGDLLLATLARGAVAGTGIDLGPGGVENARVLAAERGFADRSTFVVGDGSIASLPGADVVVLNRVVCCYPDVDGLIRNTTAAAGTVYAYTAPVDRGLVGFFNRVQTVAWNRWYALRRRKYGRFRTFVHDLEDVDRRLERAGFVRTKARRVRVVWHVAVFARRSPAT
jgi:SAM-dependent methyltransferase